VDTKKVFKWLGVFLLFTALAVVYKTFNPLENNLFPKCPLLVTTGLQCPGCGSQRAIHHLLNFDLLNALKENAILVLSIPYVITGFTFDLIKEPNANTLKWRKRLFGQKAIFIILVIIISFWILRNIV